MSRRSVREGATYTAYVPRSELRSWINGDRTWTPLWDADAMVDERPADLDPEDVVEVELEVRRIGPERRSDDAGT